MHPDLVAEKRADAYRQLRAAAVTLAKLGAEFRDMVVAIDTALRNAERGQTALCACGTGLPHAECCRLGHPRNGGGLT